MQNPSKLLVVLGFLKKNQVKVELEQLLLGQAKEGGTWICLDREKFGLISQDN